MGLGPAMSFLYPDRIQFPSSAFWQCRCLSILLQGGYFTLKGLNSFSHKHSNINGVSKDLDLESEQSLFNQSEKKIK